MCTGFKVISDYLEESSETALKQGKVNCTKCWLCGRKQVLSSGHGLLKANTFFCCFVFEVLLYKRASYAKTEVQST